MAPFFLWAVPQHRRTRQPRYGGALLLDRRAAHVGPGPARPGRPPRRENWRAPPPTSSTTSRQIKTCPPQSTHVDYTHAPLEWYLRQEATFDDLPVFFGGTLDPDETETVIAPPLLGIVEFRHIRSGSPKATSKPWTTTAWSSNGWPNASPSSPSSIRGHQTQRLHATATTTCPYLDRTQPAQQPS